MCDNECISKGKCGHNEEYYNNFCFTSEQFEVIEKLIADEKAKTIDEAIIEINKLPHCIKLCKELVDGKTSCEKCGGHDVNIIDVLCALNQMKEVRND